MLGLGPLEIFNLQLRTTKLGKMKVVKQDGNIEQGGITFGNTKLFQI
jgi:hypothetical protein